MADLTVSYIFLQVGAISVGLLPQEPLILQVFRNFCEMEPSSKDFFFD